MCALGVAVHLDARTIVPRFKTGVDSGLFPEVVSAVLVVMAAIIALSAVREMRRKPPVDGAPGEPAEEGPVNRARVWGAVAVTALYIAAMPLTGFLAATMVFLFAQMCLLAQPSERRWLVFALVAVVAAIAIHLIFVRGFGLPLPRGIF
ncbi:hypothetical protein LL06_08955 [Hoeflea sp. BAL378]|nr:hypothetical protein LL06_08955 [Hoeflea sp. BAL378]